MSNVLEELVRLLALERIEDHLFRGQSQDLGWGTVFGGQVLGQALSAAAQTVPNARSVHSLHAYFLRPGNVTKPIVYDVDRIRDGGSFTTRRVVAIQSGEAIFNLAASFQVPEDGFEHQDAMPEAPAPESLPTEQDSVAIYASRIPPFLRDRLLAGRPFELRHVEAHDDPVAPAPAAAQRRGRRVAPLRNRQPSGPRRPRPRARTGLHPRRAARRLDGARGPNPKASAEALTEPHLGPA